MDTEAARVQSPRILIDVTPLQSEHRMRGVGTYVFNLTYELVKLHPESLEFLASTVERSHIDEMLTPVHWGYRPHKPAQVYWLYNEIFLRKSLSHIQPTLFHATDFNGVPEKSRIPVIATLYDLTSLTVSGGDRSLSHQLSEWRWHTYFFRKLPQVDHVIAISEHAKTQACETLGMNPAKITVIPLGVNSNRYTAAEKGHGVYANTPPYLLYVGSADANKNLARLIDGFELVANGWKDVQLWLAGKWAPETMNVIQSVISAKHLENQVRMLGFVPTKDLPSLYANALAFVFPSLSEGFGLPIIEAMSSGIPVIASDIPIFREVADDAAVLVDPRDPAAWAKALESLLASQDTRIRLRDVGLKHSKRFHWDKVAQETWGVYEEVLRSKTRQEG